MPPMAAITGKEAFLKLDNSPNNNSRLISKPIIKKITPLRHHQSNCAS